MDPRLLEYYNAELAHLRETSAEFAREFPKIAGRLGIEGLEVADPYVERLMEGFAFIAARTQLKIDAEFPRFTQHLLEIVYPHYLRPLPSCMIVALQPNIAEPALGQGVTLPAGSRVRSVVPRGEQTACEFRTAHAVTLWPIELAAARCFGYAPDLPIARLRTARPVRSGLRLGLKCHAGLRFDQLACDELTFHIQAADEVAGPLYEAVHGHCVGAMVVSGGAQQSFQPLAAGCVAEVGFAPEQALLPYPERSFQGYRLLHEYFAYPSRYLFFSVRGLRRALAAMASTECELVLLFDAPNAALEPLIDRQSLALYATPIVNLFSRRADRIEVDDAHHEQHLVVDRARPADFEVFSVERLRGLGEGPDDAVEFRPFYGHWVRGAPVSTGAYYTVRREPRLLSARQRREGARSGYVGSEVFVQLVDEREAPYSTRLRQLAPEVLATNRDLPLLLPVAGDNVLTLEDPAPVLGVQVLRAASRPRAGVAEGDFAWRLLSHLSLNYLSIAEPGGDGSRSAAALRELLSLYATLSDPAARKTVESVRLLQSRPVIRKLPLAGPIAFGRGLEISVHLSEDAFGGAGAYLFGSVLEKFFARHVSINTFTETAVISESRMEVARWPARIGTKTIA